MIEMTQFFRAFTPHPVPATEITGMLDWLRNGTAFRPGEPGIPAVPCRARISESFDYQACCCDG